MRLNKSLNPLQYKRNKQINFGGNFGLNFNYKIFQKCFNDKNILFLKKDINKLRFKFRHLNKLETNKIYRKIRDILTQDIVRSGSKRKKIWEQGWEENFIDFKKNLRASSLIPRYYRRGRKVMRLGGKYIIPKNILFEYKISSIICKYLSIKYFKNIKNIYEFGCGPSHNLLNIAKNCKNSKNFFGLDWARSSQKILELLEKKKSTLEVNRHYFFSEKIDMLKKIENLKVTKSSACLTYGSMEQLGSNFKNFYNFMYKSPFDLIINIEPIDDLYKNNLFDQYAYKYHCKRGYLKNYLSFLKKKEQNKKIKILKVQKFIGSEMDDGWTIIIWKKIRTRL
jgi:hypothetical protein